MLGQRAQRPTPPGGSYDPEWDRPQPVPKRQVKGLMQTSLRTEAEDEPSTASSDVIMEDPHGQTPATETTTTAPDSAVVGREVENSPTEPPTAAPSSAAVDGEVEGTGYSAKNIRWNRRSVSESEDDDGDLPRRSERDRRPPRWMKEGEYKLYHVDRVSREEGTPGPPPETPGRTPAKEDNEDMGDSVNLDTEEEDALLEME